MEFGLTYSAPGEGDAREWESKHGIYAAVVDGSIGAGARCVVESAWAMVTTSQEAGADGFSDNPVVTVGSQVVCSPRYRSLYVE